MEPRANKDFWEWWDQHKSDLDEFSTDYVAHLAWLAGSAWTEHQLADRDAAEDKTPKDASCDAAA